MSETSKFLNWVKANFFLTTLFAFGIIYFRWFQLAPVDLNNRYNDPNDAYIFGLILLGIYSFLIVLSKRVKARFARILFSILSFVFFSLLFLYVWYFMPRVTAKARCNGKTYYITYNSGTLSNFWSYDQFTRWDDLFSYETYFWGYSSQKYRIICDEKKQEANFVRIWSDTLDYTDGIKPRRYIPFVNFRNEDHLFFISEKCNAWEVFSCSTARYTLYECGLDYTSCDELAFHFTEDGYNDDIAILGNKKVDEFYIIVSDDLVYVHGEKTLGFEYLDSVTIKQSEEKMEYGGCCAYVTPAYIEEYSIYALQRNNSVDYFLYGCNTVSDCWDIPFFYSTPRREEVKLIADKEENILTVFVSGNPVFAYRGIFDEECTWGECDSYECFVNGCEILDE